MRILFICSLLFVLPISAAVLHVEVDRNGFAGPIEIALAPREEGQLPEWLAKKTLAASASAVHFSDLEPGLYFVLARGPQPLERLSAKVNLGAGGATLRLTIPKSKTALRVTLAGAPLPRAIVTLIHDELRWSTELTTGDDGRFTGALWEPGAYEANVRRERTSAPHIAAVPILKETATIDVPDRHVTGRILGDDGLPPLGGAVVALRTERSGLSLHVRTRTAADGRFEFFGVGEGAHSLIALAPSYLQTDAVAFELRGAAAHRFVELTLSRGVQRAVRVVDARNAPIANAALLTACGGHVKSTSVTDAQGRAHVALPAAGDCAVYAIPKEGSIGVARAGGEQNLAIRVPAGSSSLKLTLKSEAGNAFSDLWLLMRIDGTVVPPAVARQMATRGLALSTNASGEVSLAHIPPGTYEFWPYRSEAEGQMIYDMSSSFAAPIAVNVLVGENEATVKFRARR